MSVFAVTFQLVAQRSLRNAEEFDRTPARPVHGAQNLQDVFAFDRAHVDGVFFRRC